MRKEGEGLEKFDGLKETYLSELITKRNIKKSDQICFIYNGCHSPG